jgi:hypothetical protein
VSRQRYLVRRVVVGSAALLLVVGLIRLIGALVGGDDGSVESASNPTPSATAGPVALAASPTTVTDVVAPADPADTTTPASASSAPSPAAVDASSPATAAGASTTTTSTTSTTAPSAATAAGPPTAADPARVLVVGDSDAGTFGPYLKVLLDDTELAETIVDYKVSSGLSRPDFFDWPAHLRATLPTADPDIVVVTFGGNDAQGISVASGEFIIGDPVANEEEWSEEYTRRAGEVMDLLLEGDRTVIWVGIPNDDNPEVTARMAVQDQAARAAAAARPDIEFVDTWARFSGRSGGWAEYVVDPRDGQGKDVRAGDGFHLNEIGAEILALDIAEVVKADLRARGADI